MRDSWLLYSRHALLNGWRICDTLFAVRQNVHKVRWQLHAVVRCAIGAGRNENYINAACRWIQPCHVTKRPQWDRSTEDVDARASQLQQKHTQQQASRDE